MLENELPTKVRAIFVSDLHLGCQFSTGHQVVKIFDAVEAEKIYLVGDCFDESRLRLRWKWTKVNSHVIAQLLKLKESGTEICMTPGNHDAFLRSSNPSEVLENHGRMRQEFMPLLSFNIDEQFTHRMKDGRRLLVTHGDLFDTVEKSLGGIPKLGSRIFDRVNWLIPRPIVLGLRGFFKKLFAKPNQIQSKIVQYASEAGFDGVVFGHLHQPILETVGETIVGNCGDWMGNESVLVETMDGDVKLINFGKTIGVLQSRCTN